MPITNSAKKVRVTVGSDGEVTIAGTCGGLRWLARLCLILSRNPDEGHIHLQNEGEVLTRDSSPCVIQHLAENDGLETNPSMGKKTWTSKMKKTGKWLLAIACICIGFVGILRLKLLAAVFFDRAIVAERAGEVDVVVDGKGVKAPCFSVDMQSVPIRLRRTHALELDELPRKTVAFLNTGELKNAVFWLADGKVGVTRDRSPQDVMCLLDRWMILSDVALNCTYDVRDDMKGFAADVTIDSNDDGRTYQCRFMGKGQTRMVKFRVPIGGTRPD
ncbi:MAG: hypothetical protein IJL17_04140 [Kiritimatiellae bacterium]|nr:hypothetical protein [Kiritimatiellia bacterium]